jgi:plastocyanin
MPCSYRDLKELYESGAEVPKALQMTREELATLVSQLDTVSRRLLSYQTIDEICAEGYQVSSTQTSNMGVHMSNHEYIGDGLFDLTKPEMLLIGVEGGETLTMQEVGDCVDGRWTGDSRMEVVGAAFVLPTDKVGEEHPEGFAGPLDNWHVHYNSCLGTHAQAMLSEEECIAAGGRFVYKFGWMVHAYAVPDYDNQTGVFAMWNPSIWPRVDASALDSSNIDLNVSETDTGRVSVIRDAQFEPEIELALDEALTIQNSDFLPHTVTAGKPGAPTGEFDSGPLGIGRSFTLSFDEPGEHEFYCTYHPFMVGKIVVTENERVSTP